MATATLKKAYQKVTEAFSGEPEEPELYFVDNQALKQWDREMQPILETGSNFLSTYKAVTGFAIENMAHLEFALRNLDGLYKEQFYAANEKDFASLTKLKLNFDSMIELPEDFTRAVQLRDRFKSRFGEKKREWFNIEDGQLVLTNLAYERRNKSAYLYATTREEKQRLKACRELIKTLETFAELVPAKYQGEIKRTKKFSHPLHFSLRIVTGDNGPELSPVPHFIADGWGGSGVLGIYLPSAAERRDTKKQSVPKMGEKLKKIQVIDTDGTWHGETILCTEDKLDYHRMGPFRIHKNIILDGYFNEDGAPWGTPLKPKIIGAKSTSERFIDTYKG